MSALLLFILLFLLLSAFFSAAEIAFISANRVGIEVEKNRGTLRGRVLAGFYDRPKEFLGIMLVGNNIALVVFTTLMTRLLHPFFSALTDSEVGLLLLHTLLITVVVLIFGEFLPKVLARLYCNQTIHAFAYPMLFFKWILAVPAWIMIKISNFTLKYIFRSSIDVNVDVISRLDLEDFIEGTASPVKEEIDTELFRNALHLKEVRASDCMVPRPEIVYIDIRQSISELIALFQSSRHSRLIVCDGDIDNILGYVHHQQLLDSPESIRSVLFEMPIVPETMSAKDLMHRLIREETSIACVVDEYGGTAGIVTLEDMLEEIFGEIEDEHDEEEYIEEQISEHAYRFSGRLEIDYLNEKYPGLDLPDGDYLTLSGYLVMTSGTIPDEGETIELGDYRFICEVVSDKKIETVRVERLQD